MSLQRIKTITSHAGYCRWLDELSADPIGYLARVQCEHIPSPYSYSPSKAIMSWNGRPVVCFETHHKRYEVFEVAPELLRFTTDKAATDWHIRFSRKAVQS